MFILNFKKTIFILGIASINSNYSMVRSLANSAAQQAITHILAAMNTPQEWTQFEASMANERVGEKEIEKLTQSLLKSRNIPWFPHKTFHGNKSEIRSASFSSDSRLLLTASHVHTAKIWDVLTGKVLHTLQHQMRVNSASFSPNNQLVATASDDQTAIIWNTVTGQLLHTLAGHLGWVLSVSFSPNSQWVATASHDHTAKIWNTTTGQLIQTLTGHTDAVNSVAFSPDNQLVVTASSDQTAKIWNWETGQSRRTLRGHQGLVRSASFSPNNLLIVTASGDSTAIIWIIDTGERIRTLQGHNGRVRSATFSPDGQSILTASWDQTAKVWGVLDIDSSLVQTLYDHQGEVKSALFSHDSQAIVTASQDGTIKLWRKGFVSPNVELRTQFKQLLLQTKFGTLKQHKEVLQSRALLHLYRIWQTLPKKIRHNIVHQFPHLGIPAAINPHHKSITIVQYVVLVVFIAGIFAHFRL